MAAAYLEVTEWAEVKACNHTYYLEGDRLLAYIRYGTSEPYWFNKPITISRSGRKFQRVDASVFQNSLDIIAPTAPDPDVVEVKGSKPGVVYYINLSEGSCTCPGYTYRGSCKHVAEAVKSTA